MGGRRRFLKATLAALAALVLLGGIGAGVWVASSDDDQVPAVFAAAPEADAPADEPARAEEAAEPDEAEPPEAEPPAAPDDPEQSGGSAESGAPGEPSAESERSHDPAPTQGDPQRTRFPRERRQHPDRRGKRFSVPPAHEFTGTGNALIGTVDVRQPAVVNWRARGRFGLEFGQEAFPIIAPSKSGQLVIPPYRFDLVRVLAKGRWTITVTPQR
jgi:hypothetical protein